MSLVKGSSPTDGGVVVSRDRRHPLELVGPVGLGGVGMLHIAWALGWRWPGGSDEAWAELIGGTTELPTATETGTVAVLLFGAAGAVSAAGARSLPLRPAYRRLARLAAWTAAVMLLGRSVAFLPSDLSGDRTAFKALDLTIYAPLSALLGVSIVYGLRRSARQSRRSDHDSGRAGPA